MIMKVALLEFCFEAYLIALANGLVDYVDLMIIQKQQNSIACKNVVDPRIKVLKLKKPSMRNPGNILSMIEMMRLIREVEPDILHV